MTEIPADLPRKPSLPAPASTPAAPELPPQQYLLLSVPDWQRLLRRRRH